MGVSFEQSRRARAEHRHTLFGLLRPVFSREPSLRA